MSTFGSINNSSVISRTPWSQLDSQLSVTFDHRYMNRQTVVSHFRNYAVASNQLQYVLLVCERVVYDLCSYFNSKMIWKK
uniref:2-oxoacid_dh domain-containing protein n=1 Tax=Schistosoma curassoni TaxID=6186 RepID=A0A183L4Y8_9TREM